MTTLARFRKAAPAPRTCIDCRRDCGPTCTACGSGCQCECRPEGETTDE